MMNFYTILLDVFMVALVAAIMYISIKQGFMRTFMNGTKMIFVILITATLGGYLVGVCENLFVIDLFRGKISPMLVARVEANAGNFDFDALISSLPGIVKNIVPVESLSDYCESLGGSAVEMAQKMGGAVEGFLISLVAKIIAYAVTFILAYILLTVVIKVIDKILRLPGISLVDKIFSYVWGLANCYIGASIAIFIVLIIFGRDFIDSSFISRFIFKYGLFTH